MLCYLFPLKPLQNKSHALLSPTPKYRLLFSVSIFLSPFSPSCWKSFPFVLVSVLRCSKREPFLFFMWQTTFQSRVEFRDGSRSCFKRNRLNRSFAVCGSAFVIAFLKVASEGKNKEIVIEIENMIVSQSIAFRGEQISNLKNL